VVGLYRRGVSGGTVQDGGEWWDCTGLGVSGGTVQDWG